jgi:hypothetical protein
MDGGKLTETEIPFFVCVRRARFIVVPPVIQTKVLHTEIYDRKKERALNSTGIELAPHDPSVHFLIDRSFKCSIGSSQKKENESKNKE